MRAIYLAGCLCVLAVPAQSAQPAPPRDAPIRTTPFPDVPRDHWAFDAVEQLRERGILRGYPAPPPARKTSPKPTRKRGVTS